MADKWIQDADELMTNYWSRETVTDEDGYGDAQADALARIAEQLTITNYLLFSIAQKGQAR